MARKTLDELWASPRSVIQVDRLDAHICGRFALRPRLYKDQPGMLAVKRFRIETLDQFGVRKLRDFLFEQRINYVIMSGYAARRPPPGYDENEAQEVLFE